MPVVEIVGPAPSTYTRVARMVCEEKQIPYELKQSPPHSPDVDAIHPFGKVPVMRHGDFELCKSKAISTYLDLSFPGPKLIPTEPRHAALTEQWVSLVNTKMDGTLVRSYLLNYIFPKGSDGKPDRTADRRGRASGRKGNRAAGSCGRQRRLPGRRQLHACRHQRDANSRLPEELSGIRSRHNGGEVAFGLLRPPCGAAELPEHGAAAAAGESILTHCIRPSLQ